MRSAIDAVWHDIVYAVRGYVRTPLFTGVAVGTLALGIGSTIVVFSVLDAVVLRPLPYPRSDDLVAIAQSRRDTGARLSMSPPNYFDLKDLSRSFDGVAAYGTPRVNIAGAGGDPESIVATAATPDLFTVLRVSPVIGRPFTADDATPGAPRVALLGDNLWRRRYGANRAIVGHELLVDDTPTTIVGVMPPGFAFPARGSDLWLPMTLSRTQPANPGIPVSQYRGYRVLSVVARLRSGVSLATAQVEAGRIGETLAHDYPDANQGQTTAVISLHDQMVGSARPALLLLLTAVAGVLLIACANASSLILVRASSRSHELAIRTAIGATRGRLAAQMLVESLVLAGAAGVTALLWASWTIDVFVRLAPPGLPRVEDVRIDSTAAGVAFAIATGAGVLSGLVPALHARRGAEHDRLRGAGRGFVTDANRRSRHALVVVEVAVSTILLVGASLLVQSFLKLSATDPGFHPSSVVVVDRVELPMNRGSLTRSATFYEQLLARVREAPGVESAAATIGVPLDPRARFFVDESTFSIARRPLLPMGQRPVAALQVVSADYFAAAGIPVRRGRVFDGRDRSDAQPVVVINETMARRYWGDDDPLGQTLTHDLTILPGRPSERRIVGVVADVRHFGLAQPPDAQMFIPHPQMPWPSMALLVRGTLPAAQVSTIVREAVHSLDAAVPVPPAQLLTTVVANAVGEPRSRAALVGAFATAALLLAMIGLYGAIAFTVHQRTREIGLRIALGASPADAMRLVVSSGMLLAGSGVAVGTVAAAAATRLLSAMLFGVAATDAPTFAMIPAVVLLASVAACYLPARRVRRIEPLKALAADV